MTTNEKIALGAFGFLIIVGLIAASLFTGTRTVEAPKVVTNPPPVTKPTPEPTPTTPQPILHPAVNPVIKVTAPLANAKVTSPIAITGEAKGTWYFEASFPIVLKDAQGNVIAQFHAQALGDWMTTNFVPFAASLPFPAQPAGSHGTLILQKDNPSGLPEHDDAVEISVIF